MARTHLHDLQSEAEFLRARAAVARRLVVLHKLDPLDALAQAVWPTNRVRQAEKMVSRSAIASRAHHPNWNK